MSWPQIIAGLIAIAAFFAIVYALLKNYGKEDCHGCKYFKVESVDGSYGWVISRCTHSEHRQVVPYKRKPDTCPLEFMVEHRESKQDIAIYDDITKNNKPTIKTDWSEQKMKHKPVSEKTIKIPVYEGWLLEWHEWSTGDTGSRAPYCPGCDGGGTGTSMDWLGKNVWRCSFCGHLFATGRMPTKEEECQ